MHSQGFVARWSMLMQTLHIPQTMLQTLCSCLQSQMSTALSFIRYGMSTSIHCPSVISFVFVSVFEVAGNSLQFEFIARSAMKENSPRRHSGSLKKFLFRLIAMILPQALSTKAHASLCQHRSSPKQLVQNISSFIGELQPVIFWKGMDQGRLLSCMDPLVYKKMSLKECLISVSSLSENLQRCSALIICAAQSSLYFQGYLNCTDISS